MEYKNYSWDPSGEEVFLTNANVDWGFESLLSVTLPNDVIMIDVGAHTGYYFHYLYFKTIKICAFEPNKKCYEVLMNYSNALNKIIPIQRAVSISSSEYIAISYDSGWSFIKSQSPSHELVRNSTEEIIKITSLDDFLTAE